MPTLKFKGRKSQSGQAVMEYILVSTLVGIFCLLAFKRYGAVLQKRINSLRESVVKNLPLEN